jgi:CRP/FNR family transcriptional regulator, cyclic AMP receptor protein
VELVLCTNLTLNRFARRVATAGDAVMSVDGHAVTNAVSLLDLEPELGRGISDQDWQAARLAVRSHVVHLKRGQWGVLPGADTPGVLAIVVNDGLISREIALGEHVVFELLGPGDALLPAAADPDPVALAGNPVLSILSATKVIVLSEPFVVAAARWPVLLTNLNRRLEASRRRLASQSLATHLPRAEDRVLLTLWMLAASCGRVTPDGITIPLSLSHELLARMTAARRPTVTLALRSLEAAECITRSVDGLFTLTPSAHSRITELIGPPEQAPPLGPQIAASEPGRANNGAPQRYPSSAVSRISLFP